MSLEDPFFVVRGEVQKAVNTARGLYQRWCELLQEDAAVGREELDWTTNELRNGLRSIEWDLEDLEETIDILGANPGKFKLPAGDLQERKVFVERMREAVQDMKDHMVSPAAIAFMERNKREMLTGKPASPKSSSDLLDASMAAATSRYIEEQQATQQLIMDQQNQQLEMVSGSIRVLKHMSGRVGEELDEQGVMLDAFAHEMDHTQSRMDGVLRKMAKIADSGVPSSCCWGCFFWFSSCSSPSDAGPPQGAGPSSCGSWQGPAPWEKGLLPGELSRGSHPEPVGPSGPWARAPATGPVSSVLRRWQR
ncbi:syntaxin-10 isoform X1 [Acinonyx jubatus]|uniref:Syntaxin-10 isoform X1 n=2 Tax=Acinonyx jubatus TaxID=32536 RepID=A0ABM3PVS6_ACIJB|nr:syntaxin-10 isoform X1 [Acinonyx jubatus]